MNPSHSMRWGILDSPITRQSESVETSRAMEEVRRLRIIVIFSHAGDFGQVWSPSTTYCSAISVQEMKFSFATSSAKISWKSGLSSSDDLAAARVRLEDEVCWVLAEFGPPSDSMSPVSASDWTSSNPLESTTLSVSPGLSSGLSSQSGCARSSRTILPGCKSTSWIFPKTLDQMSTTTFLFSLV